MTSDDALINKQEEIKYRLATGKYRTVVDSLLDWMCKNLQKITHRDHQVSPWYGITILFLLFYLFVIGLLYLMGEISIFRNQLTVFPKGSFSLVVLLSYLSILLLVTTNIFIHRIMSTFQNDILSLIESINNLVDFENWLDMVCNWKAHLSLSIIGGVLSATYVMYIYRFNFGQTFPIPISIGFYLFYTVIFMFLYLILCVALLSSQVGRYRLRLYSADPHNSQAISLLSGLFSNLILLAAIYAAFFVFVIAFLGLLDQYILLLIILFWLPLSILFVLYQSSLSSIVRRSKWKTLNEIQERVESLQRVQNFGDRETMDAINRLMDYHDRIKATRNTAVNSSGILSFINSLLLPLLAFILSNLDKFLALISQGTQRK